MNRILTLIVVILIPISIISKNKTTTSKTLSTTLEKISIDLPITENNLNSNQEETKTVMLSNYKDKSKPYSLDMEEYIIGVVAGEMPASFNIEALKAQAIAARTYATYKMLNIPNYILSTSVMDQVYITKDAMQKKWGTDFDYYYNRIKTAVTETKNQVLTYNGDVIIAYYFAISNGFTDDATAVFNENKDYLVSVSSTWDKDYQAYASSVTLSKTLFCNKLNISCNNITITNVKRSTNNYVREITINNTKFTGLEIFHKLNLKSTDFTITVEGNNILIKTYGFGHSVGMSQYGAEGMAKNGYNYQEILSHYYKNTEITNM